MAHTPQETNTEETGVHLCLIITLPAKGKARIKAIAPPLKKQQQKKQTEKPKKQKPKQIPFSELPVALFLKLIACQSLYKGFLQVGMWPGAWCLECMYVCVYR